MFLSYFLSVNQSILDSKKKNGEIAHEIIWIWRRQENLKKKNLFW